MLFHIEAFHYTGHPGKARRDSTLPLFEADREGKLYAHDEQYSLPIACALVWICVHAWMPIYTPVALCLQKTRTSFTV